ISAKGAPAPIVTSPTRTRTLLDDTELLQERRLFRFGLVGERGPYEAAEDRMAIERTGFELRVELAGEEPRMVGELDDLDEVLVWRQPREHQAFFFELPAKLVVELVAMPVALGDLLLAVEPLRERAVRKHAWIGAEPHRGALLRESFLRRHQ